MSTKQSNPCHRFSANNGARYAPSIQSESGWLPHDVCATAAPVGMSYKVSHDCTWKSVQLVCLGPTFLFQSTESSLSTFMKAS